MFQTLDHFLAHRVVSPGKPAVAQDGQIGIRGLAVGQLYFGQVILSIEEVKMASLDDLLGVVHGLGMILKCLPKRLFRDKRFKTTVILRTGTGPTEPSDLVQKPGDRYVTFFQIAEVRTGDGSYLICLSPLGFGWILTTCE